MVTIMMMMMIKTSELKEMDGKSRNKIHLKTEKVKINQQTTKREGLSFFFFFSFFLFLLFLLLVLFSFFFVFILFSNSRAQTHSPFLLPFLFILCCC